MLLGIIAAIIYFTVIKPNMDKAAADKAGTGSAPSSPPVTGKLFKRELPYLKPSKVWDLKEGLYDEHL